ncbi:MAG: cytochrome c3 family protein [Pseudomonadota bacterium]
MNGRKLFVWGLWILMTLGLMGYLAATLLSESPAIFLPGKTTDGHYQIESACTACHTTFGGVKQDACIKCHGEELETVNDSHPPKKFTDPRNAPKLALVDARRCVSCHREHRPAITREMGVTLAQDYCLYCHEDIATDRPSHASLPFDGCRDCHLYHDNTALHEDYLIKHLNEPDTRAQANMPQRNLLASYRLTAHHSLEALTADEQDAPISVERKVIDDWEASSHAGNGVNCLACHGHSEKPQPHEGTAAWTDKPDHEACARCHAEEAAGFLAGRHGMRLALGLTPMQTDAARRQMTDESSQHLSCVACHPAHRFDTRPAVVEACLGCHADEHSRNYRASPHYLLWQAETAGHGEPGSGVSCATCHLPRYRFKHKSVETVRVQHNQNLNLRPNQKMIRRVCIHCHGLAFTIDSLADSALIDKNFTGKPAKHIESLNMAASRLGKQQ